MLVDGLPMPGCAGVAKGVGLLPVLCGTVEDSMAAGREEFPMAEGAGA